MQDPSEDAFYAEVGHDWTSILVFAKSLGFKLDMVQFKHSDGSVVTMPFDKLQSAQGISLLRTLLVGIRAVPKVCARCKNKGYIMTIEDCHNSAGTIPCPGCWT